MKNNIPDEMIKDLVQNTNNIIIPLTTTNHIIYTVWSCGSSLSFSKCPLQAHLESCCKLGFFRSIHGTLIEPRRCRVDAHSPEQVQSLIKSCSSPTPPAPPTPPTPPAPPTPTPPCTCTQWPGGAAINESFYCEDFTNNACFR